MDDLSRKLNSILSDPKSMEMISSLLGSMKEEEPDRPEPEREEATQLPDGSIELMLKMAPLLTSFNQEDENSKLLAALRPYLKEERKKRLDEAKKIMMLLKALPFLKDSGLL